MIPGSEVGGDSRASSAEAVTAVTVKRGSMAKIASTRNWTSGSSSTTTRIFALVGSGAMSLATMASPLVIGLTWRRAAGPSQGLDLLLQLDHLQRAVDGHPLEPLELGQAQLLLGQLLGDLSASLHLLGDIAGGSEHA